MATPYETVFNSFLSKIRDMDMAILSDEDIENTCLRYLDEALLYIKASSLQFKSSWEVNADMDEFVDDLDPLEVEALAYYMVAAWYDTRINSLEATNMVFGASSDRWQDQAKFQAQMIKARKNWLLEARNLFKNYNTLNNSYLENDT